MSKKIVIGIVVAVLVAGALGGGFLLGRTFGGGAAGGPRGAFAQLTDAERQQLQNMTDEQRQAFFKEKGIDMPTGGPGGMMSGAPNGGFAGRGRGAQMLDGEVLSLDADTVTVKLADGGSVKAYLSTDTVEAAAQGSTYALAVGAKVLVFAEPEADGVTAAKAIIVK